jgi:enoyl-CoA hydratase
MSGRVTRERDGNVAILTFDHVERHNALTCAMAQTANSLLAELHDDADVRAVVLRGAGERAFMSGADIGEQDDEDARSAFLREANAMIAEIGRLPMPVIAAVRGYCLGAGVAVAAQADLRVASSDAVFGVPAGWLGLAYPYDEVARLTALVGAGAAADLLLTGRRAGAEEALRWGLVQAIHPPEALDEQAAALASTVAANAPLSLRAAKQAVRIAADGDHGGERRAAVDRLVEACIASQDYGEGRAAFRERRPPRFAGR